MRVFLDVCEICCRKPCLGLLAFVILVRKSFLIQLRGIVLALMPGSIFTLSALVPSFSIVLALMPGSIFTLSALVPSFSMSFNVVKNVVCPFVDVSIMRLPYFEGCCGDAVKVKVIGTNNEAVLLVSVRG